MRNRTLLPRWRTRCRKWKFKSEERKEVKGVGRSSAVSSVARRTGTRISWGKSLMAQQQFRSSCDWKQTCSDRRRFWRTWRMKQAQLAERHKSSREAKNTCVACWADRKKHHQSSEKTLATQHGEGGHFMGFQGFAHFKDDCSSWDGAEMPTVWAGNTIDVWRERVGAQTPDRATVFSSAEKWVLRRN